MDKIRIIFNLEHGYRMEMLDELGNVKKSMDLDKDELQEVMKELIDKVEPDMDYFLTLMMFKPKQMTFNFKKES